MERDRRFCYCLFKSKNVLGEKNIACENLVSDKEKNKRISSHCVKAGGNSVAAWLCIAVSNKYLWMADTCLGVIPSSNAHMCVQKRKGLGGGDTASPTVTGQCVKATWHVLGYLPQQWPRLWGQSICSGRVGSMGPGNSIPLELCP